MSSFPSINTRLESDRIVLGVPCHGFADHPQGFYVDITRTNLL